MEEDSNLPPSKRRKSLDLKKKSCICQDESSGRKVHFYILSILEGIGKKLLGVTFLSEFNFDLFFNYIDTSNILIDLPNFPYINRAAGR